MAVSGTWNVTMNTPMGSRDATLELTASDSDLSGRWSGQQGSTDFSGGKAAGDHAEWTVHVQGPMGAMDLGFAGDVNGDSISGTVQFGAFGSGTFSGTKA